MLVAPYIVFLAFLIPTLLVRPRLATRPRLRNFTFIHQVARFTTAGDRNAGAPHILLLHRIV